MFNEPKFRKIPDTARCVFEGIQFRIWQWPQEEFDGSIATYEAAERVPTLWALPVVGDRILIQEEVQPHIPDTPFLSLPGGRGDFDEDILKGAKRELSEESGYESDDWILWKERHQTGKIFWPSYLFIARNAKKTHEPHMDAGEKITPMLVSVDELIELSDRHDFRNPLLKDLLQEMKTDTKKKEEFLEITKIT